ncbi:MAG TPA: hypothetical protein VF112_07410 [Candidatus Dormibacteraeota bacterium]
MRERARGSVHRPRDDRCVPAGDAQRRRTAITPPLCGPCGRQHDPAEACDPDAALSVYTSARSPRQDEADHLEALSITRYTFHRPLHLSARHRPAPYVVLRPERDGAAEPACSPSTGSRPSLALAIAVVIALLAVDLVVTVLVATGLH